jgi:hypothetical protein
MNEEIEDNEEYSFNLNDIDFNVWTAEELEFIDSFEVVDDPIIVKNSEYIGPKFDEVYEIFNILFKDIRVKILERMNEVRVDRANERRENPMNTKKQKVEDDQYDKDRNRYLDSFSEDFKTNDFNEFLAVLLCASVNRKNDIKDHWSKIDINSPDGTLFIKSRMSFKRFNELFQCFTMDAEELQDMINNKMKEIYKPSILVQLDESMCPFKGENVNPHHIVVPGKPHPNGIKLYSYADQFYFLFCFLICRRTPIEDEEMPIQHKVLSKFVREEMTPTTVVDIIKFVFQFLPGYHIIVGDKYFGNLSSLDAVVKSGNDAIFQCMSNRPSKIFKLGLDKKTFEEVQFKAAAMSHILSDDDAHIYSAVSINTEINKNVEGAKKTKTLNYLSSLHIGGDVNEAGVPIMKRLYNQGSHSVDKANENVMNSIYRNKKHRWRTAVLIFVLFIIINNARIIFNKVKKQKLSQLDFIKKLMVQLSKKKPQNHDVENVSPKTGPCVYCRAKSGLISSAYFRCETCGYFHKSCLEHHIEHALNNL